MSERRRGGLWTLAFLLFAAVDCCLVSAAAGAWYYFVERKPETPAAAATEHRLVELQPVEGAVTQEAEVVVAGRVEPPARGEARIQGRLLTLGADGRFLLSGIPLREGSNRLSLVVHPEGAPSQAPLTHVVHVIRDTEPPRLVLESPLEEVTGPTASVVLRVRVEDHSPWVEVRLGERPVRVERGRRFEQVVKLSPGANRFALQAVDAAGNRSQELIVKVSRR